MKRILLILCVCLFALGVQAEEIYVVNGSSNVLSQATFNPETMAVSDVQAAAVQLGSMPQYADMNNDYLAVAVSGDNTVKFIDLETSTVSNTVFVGDGTNPYAVTLSDTKAYVSCLLTGSFKVIDLATMEVETEINCGTTPQFIDVYNDVLVVANTGVSYPNYGASSACFYNVTDLSLIKEVDLGEGSNCQYFVRNNDDFYFICSGGYGQDAGKLVYTTLEDTARTFYAIGGEPNTGCIGPNNKLYLLGWGADLRAFDLISNTITQTFAGVQGSFITADATDHFWICGGEYASNGWARYYADTFSETLASFNTAMLPVWVGVSNPYNSVPALVEAPVWNRNDIQLKSYPNPFNPETNVSFYLETAQNLQVSIYNVKGQLVKQLINDHFQAGQHSVAWNGQNHAGQTVSSGIYYICLRTDQQTFTRSCALLK